MSIRISVDLRGRFGAARNQGSRPTCMAFAASDTHSFAQGMVKYLSAEYAHYSAARRRKPLDPNRGVPMGLMIDAIREDGQPPEEMWPYLAAIPSPVSAWTPQKNCAPIFRHPMVTRPTDVSTIFSALNAGQPTLFAARITEQFYLPTTDYIIKTIPGDRDTGNHALIAVGHGTIRAGAVVLVRNSWGEDWADCGHAWVTQDYLANRILGVAVPFN
jgi:Papain family cysteine protease